MRLLAKSTGRPRIPTASAAIATSLGRRHLTNNGFFRVSEEVREALHSKKPVVALETTIYTHGFPYPENVALASLLESVVRANGGIPATIGVLDGVARVGMDPEELIRLASAAGQSTTLKLSRRDLGYVCGMRLTDKSFNGGTTVSGTMLLAHLAGIKIFGTGGLGGVHRGAESTMDISCDLTELSRTAVAVVAAGCKSFLDIPKTIEYLETEGVGISTFADGRPGNVDFPAFWSRDSGVRSPTTIADEIEAAAIIYAQHTLQITSGLLFANPIPTEFAIPKEEMDVIIADALRQADASHISGKDITPFVLAKIKELTNGKSIPANRGLIESNVKRATIIARELAILEAKQEDAQGQTAFSFTPLQSSPAATAEDRLRNASLSPSEPLPSTPATNFTPASETKQHADIVVAGALAVDFSCDYAPLSASASNTDPLPHTSNPAVITQTLGGVAHNIAKAAHLLGSSVRLHSAVGDDLSGRAAIAQLQEEGMSVSGIETLPGPSRTAQYVAINNTNKDLALAMADMSILETIPDTTTSHLANLIFNNSTFHRPKVFVADANWSSSALHIWLQSARQKNTTTIFEPVSTAKALRIFPPASTTAPSPSVYPHPLAHITTPNIHELTALHTYAEEKNFFSTTPSWFTIIDALGIPTTGLRVPLALTVGSDVVDRGTPQQAIKLLPFFPTILTKLGPKGVLMTRLLPFNDPALQDDTERQFVLARNMNGDAESGVGGLYVRLFPVEKVLQPEEVISVNGIGDTFCGALAHTLSQGRRIQDVVAFAQRAASLSLRSREAVSPGLKGLRTVVA
ncbi:IdgA domain protein [Pyrenophora tritici-repentis]|uniref:IdgA domain protein n=4 Tax=Pyrenophora tritici-repentis TaxID=45151 RepID=A0A2W1F9F4_9PLEO|nr:IdgA domain containing protein [Pyrenophora tritici-repentis Pt-1C-BFP]KAA8627175.1 IdgA domain protein [Pyrenophora tritici-repentis]EDU44717.1 IdgA domain containing protein [Pyrenophora tritici-repentis Pt-1C-BFP]KAF7455612.1 IdgA domain protein [Pyrenophora tritici-repentis]KAI0588786.1 IdgA domain protein [Pyrenophora tritici-repentis]KAI1517516.1 IdgA domain protein [Pyrenophora tritici-repentis]